MISQLRCLIIDDEKIARDILTSYLQQLPYLTLVGTCKNAIEGRAKLLQEPIDLLFLDIEMPNLNGVDFLRGLPERPLTIFTSAYRDYAVDGFELNAVDYLLKPIRFPRFVSATSRALRLSGTVVTPPQPSEKNMREVLQVRADHRVYNIPIKEIVFVESLKEYVAFHFPDGKKILSLMPLYKVEEALPKEHFLRIHRSFIIPIQRISSANTQYIFIGQNKLRVGKSYRQIVKERLLSGQ